MSKTTSYWRQKNKAQAAEKELKILRIRCAALVSNWAIIAKKSAGPRQTLLDQCSRELDNAMKKAQEAVAELVSEQPTTPTVEEQPPAA